MSLGTALGEDGGFISTWRTTATSFKCRQKRAEIFHHVTKKTASLRDLLPMKIMDCRVNLSHSETGNVAWWSQLNGCGQAGGYWQHDTGVNAVSWNNCSRNPSGLWFPFFIFFPYSAKIPSELCLQGLFYNPRAGSTPRAALGPRRLQSCARRRKGHCYGGQCHHTPPPTPAPRWMAPQSSPPPRQAVPEGHGAGGRRDDGRGDLPLGAKWGTRKVTAASLGGCS